MSTYTITISSPESEKDFADFLSNHADIEATTNEAIQYDPNMYDEHGNFQEVDVHLPGLPLSPAYLDWYFNLCDTQTDESKDISLDMLKIHMESKEIQCCLFMEVKIAPRFQKLGRFEVLITQGIFSL